MARGAGNLTPALRAFTNRALAAKLARFDVSGPVVIVAIVFALLVGARLSAYDGNPTGFIEFGHDFAAYTHPPPGALVSSPSGYDGQFFWILARDPLLLRQTTLNRLRIQSFRSQRVGYPAVAFALAAGQEDALPWTMLVTSLIAVLGITVAFAVYAWRQRWSGWWALAVGLTPGLLLATMRDLSDPFATATMFGGLLAWRGGRRWLSAGLLTVAVLAREPMVLCVAAIALDAGADWWRERREPGAQLRAVRRVWPVLLLPAAAFVGWQLYIRARLGPSVLSSSPGIRPPFQNIVDEVRRALDQDSPAAALWDIGYLTLVLAGLVAAGALLIRRVTAARAAAFLYGLLFVLLLLGDEWGASRFGAPVLVTLLLAGLEAHSRLTVLIPALAAALTLLIPFALGGG